jgi:Ca2+-binding EF-hand superfamily protein
VVQVSEKADSEMEKKREKKGDMKRLRGFKADCPDGSLGKEKILEMYSMILPAGNAKVLSDKIINMLRVYKSSQVFVDQIFRIFDKDGNGSIDFKVYIVQFCATVLLPSLVLLG